MGPLPGERVLVADADPGLRQQVHDRLFDAGIAVDCVADGRRAIDRLRGDLYAVILLDVTLPVIGAEQVLQVIRDLPAADRPVVLVLGDPGVARSLDVDLIQIVIRKPCDLTQISELVQSCVRTAIAHREMRRPGGNDRGRLLRAIT